MKNIILTIAGGVLSLLFVLFAPQLYEALYYERAFSNELYNLGAYRLLAFVALCFAWCPAFTYYYLINSVSFSRWYHWLIMLGFASVAAPIIIFISLTNTFSDLGYDFGGQIASFCLVNVFVTALLFVIASFSIRWWSSNCRHTPIPE